MIEFLVAEAISQPVMNLREILAAVGGFLVVLGIGIKWAFSVFREQVKGFETTQKEERTKLETALMAQIEMLKNENEKLTRQILEMTKQLGGFEAMMKIQNDRVNRNEK